MKKGNIRAIFSVLAFTWILSIPVFADEKTTELMSRILDGFNGKPYTVAQGVLPDGSPAVVEKKYTWKVVGSRYSTKTSTESYPKVGVVAALPEAIKRLPPDGDYGQQKSLGVQGCFDRMSNNWIDVYPTETGGDGSPAEIPLLGRTRSLDVWVWGSNKNLWVEAYIRDCKGIVHTLKLGGLYYSGWQNLRVNIPTSIPMVERVIPRATDETTFVKFRIWVDPTEKPYVEVQRNSTSGEILSIEPFYVYFSQLKVMADIYETVYDGDQLGNPNYIQKLWSDSTGGGGTTTPAATGN